MRQRPIALFLFSMFVFLAAAHGAAKPPATAGKLLFENALSAPQTNLKAVKGKWKVEDGALKGVEVPDDKHAAVTRLPLAFKQAIITFDIKFAGSRMASLSINDAKEHVARLTLTPAGFQARRDDHDHGGPDKAVPFNNQLLPALKDGWHSVTFVMLGDLLWTSVDGEAVSFGRDPLFATGMANLGFTVGGEGVYFKNLKITDAVADPSWATGEAELRKKFPLTPAPAPKKKSSE